MNVMDKDHRFEAMINEKTAREKEVRTMSEWLIRVINDNQAIGLKKDLAEGLTKGLEEGLKKGLEEGLAIACAEGWAVGLVKAWAKGWAKSWAKRWAEGWVEGLAKGAVKALADLVRKNVITLKEAAEQAGMSEAAFCEMAGLPLPQ